MGRRKTGLPRESVRVSFTPAAMRMLEDLAKLELYGRTVPEVVTRMVEGELAKELRKTEERR